MEQHFKAAERSLFTIFRYLDFLTELMVILQSFAEDLAHIGETHQKAETVRSDELMNVRDPVDALRDPIWILWMHLGDASKQFRPAIEYIRDELDMIAAQYRLRAGMSLWDRINDLSDNACILQIDVMSASLGAIRSYAMNINHSVTFRHKLEGEWSKADVQKLLDTLKTII